MRCVWSDFPEWLKSSHTEGLSKPDDANNVVHDIHENICGLAQTVVLNNKSCQRFYLMLIKMICNIVGTHFHHSG